MTDPFHGYKGAVRIGWPDSGFTHYVTLDSFLWVPEKFVFERIKAAHRLGVLVSMSTDSEFTFSVRIEGGLAAMKIPKERAFDYCRALGVMREHTPEEILQRTIERQMNMEI